MSTNATPRPADAPAAGLGPLALVLGAVSAAGVWPALTLFLLPVVPITGGLAITFGLMGVHYARRGTGRLWTAVTGTVLGAVGFCYLFLLLMVLSA